MQRGVDLRFLIWAENRASRLFHHSLADIQTLFFVLVYDKTPRTLYPRKHCHYGKDGYSWSVGGRVSGCEKE